MQQLTLSILEDTTRLAVSDGLTVALNKHPPSATLESLRQMEGISQEALADIISGVKDKIQRWIEKFRNLLTSEKIDESQYDDDTMYEMSVSEQTGKKYLALKIAGIALASLVAVWLVKGTSEVVKSKIELSRYKKGLKAGHNERVGQYASYIKKGNPYQTLQEKGTFSGWVMGKRRIEQARREFDMQLRDLERFKRLDKMKMQEEIDRYKLKQRQNNGYLWTGHQVKEFAMGRNGATSELFRILGQLGSGILSAFSSKGEIGENTGLGTFLKEAMSTFFKVFGRSLWEFIKNMGSLLSGGRPVSRSTQGRV